MQVTPSPGFDPTGTFTLEVLAKADRFNYWTYQTIEPALKGRVLEIGSGLANISIYALRDKKSITLSDINPEYRDRLKKEYAGFQNLEGVLSIDLQHPEFRTAYQDLENAYDSIFMLNVIEHLANDQAAIDNCRFMLKQEGNLVVLAPSYAFLYCRLDKELGHYRRYTTSALARLFDKSQFTILTKKYFNLAGTAGWFLFGKILQRKTLESGEMGLFNKLVPLFRIIDKISFQKAGLSSIIIAKKRS